MTDLEEYEVLCGRLLRLADEFSGKGQRFGGLHYDFYKPMLWTMEFMTQYRADVEQLLEIYWPQPWTMWDVSDHEKWFGRFYGDEKAFAPFSRMAVAGHEAFRHLNELQGGLGISLWGTNVSALFSNTSGLRGWLSLLFELGSESPTAILRVRRHQHWFGEEGDYKPSYLMHERESHRVVSAVPLRFVLLNDLFSSSSDLIRDLMQRRSASGELREESTQSAHRQVAKTTRDRVRVDHEKEVVIVDGQSYGCAPHEAREMFRLLAEAGGETRSFAQLKQQSGVLSLQDRPDRVRDRLPTQLKAYVKTDGKKGYYLDLSAGG